MRGLDKQCKICLSKESLGIVLLHTGHGRSRIAKSKCWKRRWFKCGDSSSELGSSESWFNPTYRRRFRLNALFDDGSIFVDTVRGRRVCKLWAECWWLRWLRWWLLLARGRFVLLTIWFDKLWFALIAWVRECAKLLVEPDVLVRCVVAVVVDGVSVARRPPIFNILQRYWSLALLINLQTN